MPARYRLTPRHGPRSSVRIRAPARHDGGVTEANVDAGSDARDASDDAEPADAERTTPRPRRRVDKSLLGLSLLIAIGLVLIGRGLAISITGDDRAKLPDTIERVDPVPEAVQVPNQTSVFVDLESGYTGVLVIDGTELPTVDIDDLAEQFSAEPGQQIELPATTIYEGGNATLTFTPSDEALITGFDTGLHRAQVIYWKVEESRQRPRTYSWTFTVV
jgi:hypothetical protein